MAAYDAHNLRWSEMMTCQTVFNVAIAAAFARTQLVVARVLIVDWDVHHGNGTQHLFENDPSVLYFSVHRYDNGDFFPGSRDAASHEVGHGPGAGFNINVAWNIAWKDRDGMGDDEYLAVWHCLLLPIAARFDPQIILVSAGFDSAIGDVGGCCVTPDGFAQLTRMLQSVCSRVVLVLEGGYETGVVSDCFTACARALLGDDLNLRSQVHPKNEARLSIERTLHEHRPYWNCLQTMPSSGPICLDTGSAGTTEPSPVTDSAMQTGRRRHKQSQERAPTGVPISTRNTAERNWRIDVKKLGRKKAELMSTLEKIKVLHESIQKGAKISRKDRALFEQEDETCLRLQEAASELHELQSLSDGDVIRMYAGAS